MNLIDQLRRRADEDTAKRELREHLERERQRQAAVVPEVPVGPVVERSVERKDYQDETERILSLPVAPDRMVDLNPELRRKDAPRDAPRLWPEQSLALDEIRRCGGGLIGLAVGAGKAYIALLSRAVLQADLAVILAPARTIDQLRHTAMVLQRSFTLGSLRLISYNAISNDRPNSNEPELLEELTKNAKYAVIVADEAHYLANPTSGRTKKVWRFFKEHQQHAFVGLSGTLTSKSLREFSHLSGLALRHGSPVPRPGTHLNAWAECVDVDGQPGADHWRVVEPLMAFGGAQKDLHGEARRRAVRQAFQKRLRTTPGVVISMEGSLGTSLVIQGRQVEVPEVIQAALLAAETAEEDPTGEILADDVSRWRFKRQISAGFWYLWRWPNDEPDFAWMQARSAWRRAVVGELEKHGQKGYDTPKQVEDFAKSGDSDVPPRLLQTWLEWAEHKHKPAPPVEPQWVSTYLIEDAAAFAKAQGPMIVWYESDAVRDALAKHMKTFGAGDDVPVELLQAKAKGFTCAMSWRAQATGLNLQHAWSQNLVLEPPPGNKAWEQLLGRTHRPHQPADEVLVHVYQHTSAYKDALKKARLQATYVEDTSGARQKLCIATFAEVD